MTIFGSSVTDAFAWTPAGAFASNGWRSGCADPTASTNQMTRYSGYVGVGSNGGPGLPFLYGSNSWATAFTHCEVCCDTWLQNLGAAGNLSTNQIFRVLARQQNPGGAAGSYSTYWVQIRIESGWLYTSMGKIVNGVNTVYVGESFIIGSDGSNGFTMAYTNIGDKLGIRIFNWNGQARVEGYFYAASGTRTNILQPMYINQWRRFGTFYDSSILGSGYPGVGVQFLNTDSGGGALVDNFRAAEISIPTYTIDSDVFPGFTGAKPDPTTELILPSSRPGLNLTIPALVRPDPIGDRIQQSLTALAETKETINPESTTASIFS